jgi:hypothetical protein
MLSAARSVGLCFFGAYLVPHPVMVHPPTYGPLGAMVTGMTGIVADSFRQRKVVITPRRPECTSCPPVVDPPRTLLRATTTKLEVPAWRAGASFCVGLIGYVRLRIKVPAWYWQL